MAGIYIHIPYCKQACHYCNFHFSTSTDSLSEVIDAILTELNVRQAYLENEEIETIYFGGGTPSMVPTHQLQKIINHIQAQFSIDSQCEITLEANPDDINPHVLQEWVDIGINRLSLGVQSFHDDDLFFMNRAHSGKEAFEAISSIVNSDIKRITADIIFGYDGLTEEKLLFNLKQIHQTRIHHLSCYAMTIEPKTALHHQIKTGQVQAMKDMESASQFNLIRSVLTNEAFDHYEISNYARDHEYAIHNTHYWKNRSYLGLGPSAHSYNGITREWNVANNIKYLKSIQNGESISEIETLSPTDKYNEYIMTGLRTKWGVSTEKIERLGSHFLNHFHEESQTLFEEGKLIQNGSSIQISEDHLILCDAISSTLFLT